MKKIKDQLKKALPLCALTMLVGATACTDNFESINTNPNGLEPEDIKISARFFQPMSSIYCNFQNRNWEYQLQQNLNADLWSGYMAVPTPFGGNYNNSTYAMNDGWNEYPFLCGELYVMKPISEILKSTEEADYVSVAKIVRVTAMHRVSDVYGPIPYSQAMQGGETVPYDDQETLYKTFLQELEESVNALTTFVDTNPAAESKRMSEFDIINRGDNVLWIRFANSLRLRLAMRIVKVDPALAKSTAEAAVNHKYGILTSADKNIEVVDASLQNPLNEINFSYSDIRMSASMISMLKGYSDPRLPKYATPVGWFEEGGVKKDILNKDGNATNKIGEYVGIRQGVIIPDKNNYIMYSTINMPSSRYTDQNGGQNMITNALPIMKVAEVYFLRAEGALRGWNMGGSAKDLYEQGIKVSFNEYGISEEDYAKYINNSTGVSVDYEDPFNPSNNIAGIDKATVKWEESVSQEEKLHKIMNQKWLAMFPEGQEAWSEFRRTGYPKLFPAVTNYSDGNIPKGEFPKRLRFPRNDRNSNMAEVEKARTMLKGDDHEGTRLWWDVEGGNF
ncbi:hypothetical protein M2459_003604 [Parabacteroides sp. PF5-5]|uniref:SusD/RagB family nutrient-binding outer membrane lipoprotein n=1 Tax=unclassified Parabacteroides TaxID=2649774 RepID=UPI002475A7D5|nr:MULTISPECIES: SusD/RagB family nutrient-binding outer membrane lipoprotein [unclassified Parabacteroides]MDH6306963.1 hypothetical protein [Parabacteroides sp. PH5-39]MDH6317837.1 hypothetical protein [Parabacteroides sp. PF5-13]MDH6321568.1 hypothetical protein [Parabacteroides sp. PH5-13]MDH6325356.1 hypothetical protein [Parabacteroides sp. PH5-8]MDH6329027.1 hypothetical protein [Parabacteroides sp. PH5-41]